MFRVLPHIIYCFFRAAFHWYLSFLCDCDEICIVVIQQIDFDVQERSDIFDTVRSSVCLEEHEKV